MREPTSSYLLLEERGKVFESSASERSFFVTDPVQGKRIYARNRKADELTVSCYGVLPREAPATGRVNLLTVGRSRRSGVLPPIEDVGGDFLVVSYYVPRSILEFHVSVGRDFPILVTLLTVKVPWAALSGRVLQLFVEITRSRVFASVNEAFAGGGDLFFDAFGPATSGRLRPWGSSPWGRWVAALGISSVAGLRFVPLPPGFGLSDLQVAFGAEEDLEPIPLDYSGDLDHLVTRGRPLPPPAPSASDVSAAERELSLVRRLVTGPEDPTFEKGETQWPSC